MSAPTLTLHGYWRSSCSWRVRIGLNWKGIRYAQKFVHLAQGEQNASAWQQVSPLRTVPMLEWESPSGTQRLTQSLAILEYVEEAFPGTPRLLPEDPVARATVRQLAEMLNSGIQPLHNLQINNYVRDVLKGDVKAWCEKWIGQGLDALEAMAKASSGQFMVGDQFTFADACLLPQLFGARRFATVEPSRYPTLTSIETRCLTLDFVQKARPENQPDATPA